MRKGITVFVALCLLIASLVVMLSGSAMGAGKDQAGYEDIIVSPPQSHTGFYYPGEEVTITIFADGGDKYDIFMFESGILVKTYDNEAANNDGVIELIYTTNDSDNHDYHVQVWDDQRVENGWGWQMGSEWFSTQQLYIEEYFDQEWYLPDDTVTWYWAVFYTENNEPATEGFDWDVSAWDMTKTPWEEEELGDGTLVDATGSLSFELPGGDAADWNYDNLRIAFNEGDEFEHIEWFWYWVSDEQPYGGFWISLSDNWPENGDTVVVDVNTGNPDIDVDLEVYISSTDEKVDGGSVTTDEYGEAQWAFSVDSDYTVGREYYVYGEIDYEGNDYDDWEPFTPQQPADGDLLLTADLPEPKAGDTITESSRIVWFEGTQPGLVTYYFEASYDMGWEDIYLFQGFQTEPTFTFDIPDDFMGGINIHGEAYFDDGSMIQGWDWLDVDPYALDLNTDNPWNFVYDPSDVVVVNYAIEGGSASTLYYEWWALGDRVDSGTLASAGAAGTFSYTIPSDAVYDGLWVNVNAVVGDMVLEGNLWVNVAFGTVDVDVDNDTYEAGDTIPVSWSLDSAFAADAAVSYSVRDMMGIVVDTGILTAGTDGTFDFIVPDDASLAYAITVYASYMGISIEDTVMVYGYHIYWHIVTESGYVTGSFMAGETITIHYDIEAVQTPGSVYLSVGVAGYDPVLFELTAASGDIEYTIPADLQDGDYGLVVSGGPAGFPNAQTVAQGLRVENEPSALDMHVGGGLSLLNLILIILFVVFLILAIVGFNKAKKGGAAPMPEPAPPTYEQPPAEQPPMEQQPYEAPPPPPPAPEQPPMDQPPVDQPPVDQPPAEEPPQ